MPGYGAGRMLERLTIQRNDPPSITVSSITRSSTTATATTLTAHGFTSNDYVTIAGADQSAYNGKVKVTVTGTTTFTFTVSGSPTTPATGSITAVYVSDDQGAAREVWRDLATVPAELVPLRAAERLQAAAIQSLVSYRFRVRVRTDLVPQQRISWTPRWPVGATAKTLQILGVLPVDDGRSWLFLEAGEVAG